MISEHFAEQELLSPKLLEIIKESNVPAKWFIREDTIDFLEDLRIHFGTPVEINHKGMGRRGICTLSENLAEGRTELSQHNYQAFDISLYSENLELVYSWIVKNAELYNIGGIGLYDTFIHVDMRNSDILVEWDKRNV